jgi:flagellar protein FliO/FliZ
MTSLSSLLLAVPALAAVLGMIWLAQRAARAGWLGTRLLAPAPGRRLGLVQALALDSRRRLHLVCCDGRHVLLLTGGGQDLVVGWLEPEKAP